TSNMLKHLTVDEIHKIIHAAKELNAKHPPSDTGTGLSDVKAGDILDYEDDAKKLKDEIAALRHDARMELMALMWIGRDFEGTFDQAVKEANEQSDDDEVDYIAEKSPALPIYLANGLKKIGL